MPTLPSSVQQIADVIGREPALELIRQLPRRYPKDHPIGRPILYVPRRLTPDHPLVAMIGWHTAAKLVRAFGGEILYPAACADMNRQERNRGILRMLKDGASLEIAAHVFGVTKRHVRNIRRAEISVEELPQ